jgi:hypothetical protein
MFEFAAAKYIAKLAHTPHHVYGRVETNSVLSFDVYIYYTCVIIYYVVLVHMHAWSHYLREPHNVTYCDNK